MPDGVSGRSGAAAGSSLHYSASPPAGIGFLFLLLAVGALSALTWPVVDAGVPSFWFTFAGSLTGALAVSAPARRVELTGGGRLLLTGFGQHVGIEAGRITAISLPRRARLGFGSAVVDWEGGRFRIWQSVRYTPGPRRWWSFRYVSGRGGKDFGDLVYRLRLHNPALIIQGVEPPVWALPQPVPQPPPRW